MFDDPPVLQAGVTEIAVLVVGMALSYFQAKLAAKKNRAVLKDENPDTQVSRGAYVPLIIGRDRIGPVIGFVGSQLGSGGPTFIGDGPSAGGKRTGTGGGTGSYSDSLVHLLCVGPVSRIIRIWSNGKEIFSGDITPETNPSGTTVTIGGEGSFRVYWGEPDQPVDPLILARLGINSRFPFMCYVVWDTKNFGSAPNAPLIEYEVEAQAHGSQLVQSPAWINGTYTDASSSAGDALLFRDPLNLNRWVFYRDVTGIYTTNSVVRVSGQMAIDLVGYTPAYLHVFSSVYDVNEQWTDPNPPNTRYIGLTSVYFSGITVFEINNPQTPIAGSRIAKCIPDGNDGVNIAHALDQLFFSSFPHGAGKDRGDFDTASLEAVGVQLSNLHEGLKGTIKAENGEQADATIGALMADAGIQVALDPVLGKYIFKLLREPEATRPQITQGLILGPKPEIENLVGEREGDKLIFTFRDASRRYRDVTFIVDDDGQAIYTRVQKARNVGINSTREFVTARKISDRRGPEELATPSKFRLQAAREARRLSAGLAIDVAGFDDVIRLISVKPDPYSEKTELIGYIDFYGLPSSLDTSILEGPTPDSVPAVEPPSYPTEDVQAAVVELPRYISDGKMQIGVFRIRSSADVIGAWIWLSRDGSSYKRIKWDEFVHTGGVLSSDLAVGSSLVASVPIDAVGVDTVGSSEDLTSDEESWRLGRQIALIDGAELCYVQSVTGLGGSSFSLDNVLRGRLGTSKTEHLAGKEVFIAQSHEVTYVSDVLLQPNKTLYVKIQPVTKQGAVALENVTPRVITLQGKAYRPLDPVNLRTDNHCNAYVTGQDITFIWRHRSVHSYKTGAGMQAFGAPTGESEVEGDFVVRILNGTELYREIITNQTMWTYTNADLIADFGSEPSTFNVQVYNSFSGYKSAVLSITVVKV